MSELFSKERFEMLPIVGILRGFSREQTLELAKISAEVGLKNLEITMNTDGVEDQIRVCLEAYGSSLNVGAGTVCHIQDLERALNVGAQFIVTPNVNVEVIEACVKKMVPVFAGAFTPTEIEKAYRAGASMVKIFPAETLGPAYLKAVGGPFNQIPLMPTGGVTPDTMQAWKDAGAKAYGVGGKLYNADLAELEDWDGLRELAESFVSAYQKLK
jgi:2-dehydro-3-deoxyphosphogluconate aldolase/(4S)-4-hydroxy-2-oxoglutarate aldolase